MQGLERLFGGMSFNPSPAKWIFPGGSWNPFPKHSEQGRTDNSHPLSDGSVGITVGFPARRHSCGFLPVLGMSSDPEEGSLWMPPDLLIPHSRCFGKSGNAGPGLGGGESFPIIPGNHIPVPEGPCERLRIHMIPKSLSSFSPHQRTTRCRNSGLALGSFSMETEAYSGSSPTAGIWDGAGAPGQGFCHLPSSQRRFREEFFPLCSLWRARGILRLILDLFGMMQPSVGGIPWNSSRWRTPFSVPASHPAQREFGHFCSASLPDRIHERGFKEAGRNVG